MNNLDKLLFKKNRPVIRKIEMMDESSHGDFPILWDAYKKDLLGDIPQDMDMAAFVEYVYEVVGRVHEVLILEDFVRGELETVGAVFCAFDGWLLEPHMIHFDNATPRIILRTYIAFLKKTKWRKEFGACLIRVEKKNINLPNRVEKMGLIEWVGKIWGGKPSGNEYLYSMRCARRS